MEDSGSNKEKMSNLGYFILTVMAVFIISFFVLFFIERQIRSVQFSELIQREERVVSIENNFIGKEFGLIISDMFYLKYAHNGMIMNSDSYDEIAKNWAEYSTHRLIYDQIRFIDTEGNEKIRINYSGGKGQIVPQNKLTNRKSRYYFYETIGLREGSIHVSPLDLNVENGQVEEPYKPMLRFSTPIYSPDGQIKGIMVLNYLAEDTLGDFKNLAQNSAGELVLLNADSYWLTNKNPDLEWNFMFDNKKEINFKEKFPKEWERIISGDGQILTDAGLFTFSTIDLHQKIEMHSHTSEIGRLFLSGGKWHIVSHVPRQGPYATYFVDHPKALILDVLKKNSLYFLLIFCISILLAIVMHVNRKTYARIKYFSEFDPLTKVYNRRAGIAQLNQLIPLDERRHFLMSLCFIDVNGLKQVNDVLGHRHGDELIVTVVEVIRAAIREEDFVIRMGGDEFLIVLNGIDVEEAEKVWDRIRQGYERINETEEREYVVSVSHGIVSHKEHQKSEIDDLIKLADEKMYKEKSIIKANFKAIK